MKKLFMILAIMLAFSCSRRSAPSKTAESFDDFYTRFHQDSLFQLERVKFPLEGSYVDIEGEFSWERSDWEMHREKVTDIHEPGYDTEIVKKENMVVDKVKLRDSGFYAERRFQLIDGKWYLVYYESVNL